MAFYVQLIDSEDGMETLAENIIKKLKKVLNPAPLSRQGFSDTCLDVKEDVKNLREKLRKNGDIRMNHLDEFAPYVLKVNCEPTYSVNVIAGQ